MPAAIRRVDLHIPEPSVLVVRMRADPSCFPYCQRREIMHVSDSALAPAGAVPGGVLSATTNFKLNTS